MTNNPLDSILPEYQFVERHRTIVSADPATVFACTENVDLVDSKIALVLMALWRLAARMVLRGIPSRPMSVRDFIPLLRKPPVELARGLISGSPRRTWTVEDFAAFRGPGFKLVWGYVVRKIDGSNGLTCRVETETRVYCCDQSTKRWFTIYWLIIRPWSGLIRRDLLRIIRARAEKRN